MPDVLIRGVPSTVLEALKARASTHQRSLQGELLALLQEASAEPPSQSPATIASAIRETLAARCGTLPDSTSLVREDRAR